MSTFGSPFLVNWYDCCGLHGTFKRQYLGHPALLLLKQVQLKVSISLDTTYQPIRGEAPSTATTDTDDILSLADEGQVLSRAADQFAKDEDCVSTASSISNSTLELPISRVAPEEEEEEEEEEEDWVWEGLSQWSIELSIPQ